MKWKWLFWLLVVVNVGLYGYFELSKPLNSGAVSGHEPMQPEKMKLLTPQQLEALPKSAPGAHPLEQQPVMEQPAPQALEQLSCYEWGSFPSKRLVRARGVVDRFGLDTQVQVIANQEAIRYWVYIPPLGSFQEAQARNDALRSLGIADTFIVQDAQWKNAISFGVFKDEVLAARRAEDMRNRGVTDVIKAVRNKEGRQSVLLIRNISDSTAEEIRKLKPDFPYSELKQVACQ
ncbi:MAG: sporulation protein [Methylophilaceae bacterium]|jgi:hypothetical protein